MMEGPGADSEEKHEPVSDIDTAVVVVGLKALDPEWPIREAIIKTQMFTGLSHFAGSRGPNIAGAFPSVATARILNFICPGTAAPCLPSGHL